MITEEALTELLGEAAQTIPLPGGGPERVVAAAPQPRIRVRPRRTAAAWLAAAAVAVLAGSGLAVALTGGSNAPVRTAAGGGQALDNRAVAAAPPVGQAYGPAHSSAKTAAGNALVLSGTRVVKTGTADLQAPAAQVASVLAEVQGDAAGLGGYVQSSSSQESGRFPDGNLTLRVPVANFDTLVNEVRRAGHVVSIVESGQDVTAQYVDLSARISALEVSRSTYLTILSKATTIGDILAVQQQVDSVQQQLEELQGQQKLLADQSDNATLTVNVSTPAAAAVVPPPPSGLHRAFNRSVHGFVAGFEDVLAALGPLLLVLLILAVLGFAARLGWRAVRRQLV